MDSHYSKQTLSNGLTLLTIPMPSVQSVTALLLVRVGSRYENKQQMGISHFLEHMVFKGTKKYPTTLKLASAVDSIGAEFNAFTAKEYTGFYVKASSQHLELALDILSQLTFHPLLDPLELEKERGVIIEEINMYEDQPMAKVGNDFESLLYGDTPLGWETIGLKETIRKIQRQNFFDYLQQWYQPQNMVLGLAGAITQIQTLVEKYFILARNDLARSKTGFQDFQPEAGRPLAEKFKQEKPALHLRYKKTEQAHFCLGVRALERADTDRYALAVLSTILGGNMSSRLFIEVREKRGLAYYVKTSPQAYLDNGYLVTQAGTAINKASEAMRVILEEYYKMINDQGSMINKNELTKAKEYLKGKLILDLEDSQEVAGLYTEDYLLEGKARTPEEILKKINAVTAEDVARVAGKIFRPKGLNLSVIGPYKDGDRREFESIIK